MKLMTYASLAMVCAMACLAADTDAAASAAGPLLDADGKPVTPPEGNLQADLLKPQTLAQAPKTRAPKTRAAAVVEEEDDGLVEAIVRRGHVDVGTFAEPDLVGPGGTVRLGAKTVARLRADGVLVDPEAAELPEWKGPTVGAA